MDLPKFADVSDTTTLQNLQNMSERPNTIMLKGTQNQLKIISVTSKPSRWDLRLKYSKQDNNVQEYPDLEADMQEYTEINMQEHIEDIHAGTTNQCIEMNNLQEYTESIPVELDTTNLCMEVNNLQECTEAHMQEYTEDRCDELDTTNQCVEMNNFQACTETDLQEYTEGIHELDPTNRIKVKNEIIEELDDSSNNIVQVKEEVTSDLEIDDSECDVDNVMHNGTEPKDNFPNVKIEKVFRESENTEPVNKVDGITKSYKIFYIIPKSNNKVDKVPDHYGNLDRVLKHFNTVKSNQKADEFSTLKCTVCFKAFLGEDAYNDHMKQHTTIESSADEGNPSSVVLKIGDTLCTLFKVKKIRKKRLIIETRSSSAKNVDDSRTVQNNSDSNSVQNDSYNIHFDSPIIQIDDDSNNAAKVDGNNENNALKVGVDSDIKIANEDILIERQNNIHFDSTIIEVESDDDNSKNLKVDDNNENIAVKVGVDSDNSDIEITNEDLLIERQNNIHFDSTIIEVESDDDNSNTLKVDDNNENDAVNVGVDDDNSDFKIENEDLLIERQSTKPIRVREQKTRTPIIMVDYIKRDENCANNKMKSFYCNMCEYKCAQRSNLDQHMRIHLCEKPFSCNFCGYECVQRSQLDQHVRTHTRVKPFTCNFCEYTCTQRSHLDQHVRTHTRVKPFTCNFCEYTCTQRSHLDQHMRRHTGMRPFRCVFCGYTCVQLSHLNRHIMNTHRNVHVFKCYKCNYRCLHFELIAKHMNNHNKLK